MIRLGIGNDVGRWSCCWYFPYKNWPFRKPQPYHHLWKKENEPYFLMCSCTLFLEKTEFSQQPLLDLGVFVDGCFFGCVESAGARPAWDGRRENACVCALPLPAGTNSELLGRRQVAGTQESPALGGFGGSRGLRGWWIIPCKRYNNNERI